MHAFWLSLQTKIPRIKLYMLTLFLSQTSFICTTLTIFFLSSVLPILCSKNCMCVTRWCYVTSWKPQVLCFHDEVENWPHAFPIWSINIIPQPQAQAQVHAECCGGYVIPWNAKFMDDSLWSLTELHQCTVKKYCVLCTHTFVLKFNKLHTLCVCVCVWDTHYFVCQAQQKGVWFRHCNLLNTTVFTV
jgi:hypothetical protein